MPRPKYLWLIPTNQVSSLRDTPPSAPVSLMTSPIKCLHYGIHHPSAPVSLMTSPIKCLHYGIRHPSAPVSLMTSPIKCLHYGIRHPSAPVSLMTSPIKCLHYGIRHPLHQLVWWRHNLTPAITSLHLLVANYGGRTGSCLLGSKGKLRKLNQRKEQHTISYLRNCNKFKLESNFNGII